MKNPWRRICLIGIAVVLAIGAAAAAPRSLCADPVDKTLDHPLADPAMEARARTLMKEIRCVVCQSESINESDADIATDLRNIVREQMAAGHSDQEIEDYLTARYGDFVLLDPPFKARTLILWLGPFVLVAVAALGIYMAVRKRRGHAGMPRAELTLAERNRLRELLGEAHEQGGGS
ncbi:MAG TPA: cytochrome c-type biogenesis protein [Dongiaceae bacterium]|jgi:cytochrome c-type biogenesis protein CcmH